MAQFQSYGGGPHGGSPIVLPQRQGVLGDIGSLLSGIGQIPQQYQQGIASREAATLKSQLNNLLMKSLTLPREVPVQQDVPDDSFSFGDVLSKPEQQPNPEYVATQNRLRDVGPAFGFKYPTSAEELYMAQLAKSLGKEPELTAKSNAKVNEIKTKAEEDRKKQEQLYSTDKPGFEAVRQKNRMEQLTKLEEGRNARARQHEENVKNIANDKNANDQTKIDKVLRERSRYHQDQIIEQGKRTEVFRAGITSQDENRKVLQLNGWNDDLVKLRTQIDKIREMGSTDPSVQAELQSAVQQFNGTVDNIKQMDSGAKLDYYDANDTKAGVMNRLRSLMNPILPDLFNPPQKQLGIVPSKPAPTKPAQTKPMSNTTGATPMYDPRTLSDEEVAKRRKAILGR